MSSGFVSEVDLAEKRRVRQMEWQKNKKEEDPDEAPEEVVDHRTLFERLQEQKDKKQEDWEEAHKLKNMVRGLEDDEVDFLEFVDNTKLQQEKKIKQEENSALEEYRKKVAVMQKKAIESETLAELKPEVRKCAPAKKSGQASLLAGAIKRKREAEDESSQEDKDKAGDAACTENKLRCVAVLPGMGVYTDSSDSDNDSNSDSDLDCPVTIPPGIHRDITGRLVQFQSGNGKGCC